MTDFYIGHYHAVTIHTLIFKKDTLTVEKAVANLLNLYFSPFMTHLFYYDLDQKPIDVKIYTRRMIVVT